MLINHRRGSDDVDGTSPGSNVLETRTWDRVRRLLAEDGPLTAAELVARLQLTPAAVRRHLDQLAEEGAVEEREPALAGGRGRPARAYVLSAAGHAGMSTDYEDVATAALRFLAERAGEDAVGEFARERGAELERRYATALPSTGGDIRSRAEALAAALNTDGFSASIRPGEADAPIAGVHLCQGHCPVLHVAAEFPVFCDVEADVFARLLGVPVERRSRLVDGEHACATFIPLDAIPVVASESVPQPSKPTAL